jgi:hypothetical protein
MKSIPQNRMDELLGRVLNGHPDEVRQLLSQNGVSLNGLSDADVRLAFLKAVKDSASFRKSAAVFLASFVQTQYGVAVKRKVHTDNVSQDDLFLNEVDAPALPKITNLSGSSITGSFGQFGSGGSSAPISYTNDAYYAGSAGPTAAPSTSTSFWSALGGAATSSLGTVLSSGLDVLSVKLKNDANKSSEERALQAKQLDLQIAQTNAAAAAAASSKPSGLGTGAWIGIGVGVVALVTVLIVVAKKS